MKDPDSDIFNFDEKKNQNTKQTEHLDKYLRKTQINYTNEPVKILKSFIKGGDGSDNYRKDLSNLINNSPLIFDYLLVKDLFMNSMEH